MTESIKHPSPEFDGHLERPFAALTAEEKLDELWMRIVAVRTLRGLPLRGPEPAKS